MTGKHEQLALDRLRTAARTTDAALAIAADDAMADLLTASGVAEGLRAARNLEQACIAIADHTAETVGRLRGAVAAVTGEQAAPAVVVVTDAMVNAAIAAPMLTFKDWPDRLAELPRENARRMIEAALKARGNV